MAAAKRSRQQADKVAPAEPCSNVVPVVSINRLATEDRRLRLLQLLAKCGGYKMNSGVLLKLLDEMGHAVSSDRLSTDLYWLAEQELVQVHTVDGLLVATLLTAGLETAEGRRRAPGVAPT